MSSLRKVNIALSNLWNAPFTLSILKSKHSEIHIFIFISSRARYGIKLHYVMVLDHSAHTEPIVIGSSVSPTLSES